MDDTLAIEIRRLAGDPDGPGLVHRDGRPQVSGLHLRYLLTTLLLERGAHTMLDDLADAVASEGFVLPGRPSKVISDALRWEIGRGRVVRHGRGLYGPGTIPRQTKSRIRRRVRLLRDHVAATRGDLLSPHGG